MIIIARLVPGLDSGQRSPGLAAIGGRSAILRAGRPHGGCAGRQPGRENR